jgi:cytosine/adenosine deaminase-related metal-dependent hydrolase
VEGRLLLKNCSLFRADGRVRSGMSVLIEGRLITSIGPDADAPVRPGDWEVKCDGRLVTTGLIDCHTRLVGGALTPWAGDLLLRPFSQRFAQEHRLERTLTVGEVEALTAFSIARSLRAGVTMAVEHLHAPACVEEALTVQAKVAEQLGMRLINSHASSSVVAGLAGPEQVEANGRYAKSRKQDSLVRAAIGVRASFCADDDLLRLAGHLKEELSIGAHFGLAENDDDLAITWSKTNSRIVTRFERFGLLGGASVGAHARAIDRTEAARLAKSRTLVAFTPRAAQTVEGGSALGMEAVLVNQNLVGLGSGGTGSLWEELAASYTGVMAMARAGRMLDPDNLMSSFLVGGPAELCTMVYGAPCGSVEPGALADLVVYDFVPARETGNFTPHLLMQLSQMPVGWTIVDGRVSVREGQLLGANFNELARDSALALESIWKRSGVTGGGAAPS